MEQDIENTAQDQQREVDATEQDQQVTEELLQMQLLREHVARVLQEKQ